MGIERLARTGLISTIAFVLVFSFVSLHSTTARAQVVLQMPLQTSINSEFKMRWGRPHTGLDLQAATPTPIPTNGVFLGCPRIAGYGIQGKIGHACGVEEHFSHLSECGPNKMVTGSSADVSGEQGRVAAHLHYEILINGTFVDPQEAFGQDLCKGEVRQRLIDDANRKINGKAGGGGGAGATSNEPPPSPAGVPAETVTEVQTGQKDPHTGVINTGPTYYSVQTPDGRVTQEYIPGDEPMTQNMLPATTSDIVPAGSSNNDITGCGTDTWRAMVNQAVLQTRREMLMNERYIAKADSVLAYSCFAQTMEIAGQYLGVFSETEMWRNKDIDILDGSIVNVRVYLGAYSLDGAITNAALHPYDAWLHGYFNHDFLGGLLGGTSRPGGGGEDEEGNSVQSYAPCGIMGQVWQQAKCMNVTDDPMFYRFTELIGNDPRKYPPNYACNDSGIYQNMIDIARNKSAEFSKVVTHFDLLKPPGNTCAPPIPTGVTVTTREGADRLTRELTYPDGLCITPGCSYQKTGAGASAGTCEVKQPRLGSS